MFMSARSKLVTHIKQTAQEKDVQKVLDAIDKFPDKKSLYILTEDLGSILDKVVKKFDPKVALELGISCGCSAIRIASKMAKPKSKLLTIQPRQAEVDTANNIIQLAGLNEKVEVQTLNELGDVTKFLNDNGAPCFDFIFIDHSTNRYLQDLLFLQKKGVLGKGTVIVANTMGYRVQDYLKHLKDHPEELQTEIYKSESGSANMTVSVCIVA
jgi:predicted O-methyltransferase YrrM